MNPYFAIVDRLKMPAERFQAMTLLSAAGLAARHARGKRLPPQKVEALIWGLSHEHPVVRRCCIELLDLHPDGSAIPHIVSRLEDAVPKVRWHAVHALACDTCKLGESFFNEEVLHRLQQVAAHDPSPKVRDYARQELEGRGYAPAVARS